MNIIVSSQSNINLIVIHLLQHTAYLIVKSKKNYRVIDRSYVLYYMIYDLWLHRFRISITQRQINLIAPSFNLGNYCGCFVLVYSVSEFAARYSTQYHCQLTFHLHRNQWYNIEMLEINLDKIFIRTNTNRCERLLHTLLLLITICDIQGKYQGSA